MKSVVSVLSIAMFALTVCVSATSCGDSKGSSGASIDSLCKSLIERAKKAGEKKADSMLGECRKSMNKRKEMVGEKIFSAYATCAVDAKDNAAFKSCEKTMAEAAQKIEKKLGDIRQRVYATCSKLGKNTAVLKRTSKAGGKNWGFSCTKAVMKLYKKCDPATGQKMLKCLEPLFDPDDLTKCTKMCEK